MTLPDAGLVILLGVGAGMLGAGLRVAHLELDWWLTRRDLRKFYQRTRADRVFDIPKKPAKSSLPTNYLPGEMNDEELWATVDKVGE